MTTYSFFKHIVTAVLCTTLLACQQGGARQSYLINAEQAEPSARVVEHADTCSELLVAIQRLENAPSVDVVTPQGGGRVMSFRSDHKKTLKILEKKAQSQGCLNQRDSSPKSDETLPTERQRLSFDQCFTKCEQLTQRTAEQCFDACR